MLRDKVVVVTGGFGVLGQAVAILAASRGALVGVLDLALTAPAGLKERLGSNALMLGGVDLGASDATEKAFDMIKAHFERIDVLINVAGGFRWETVADGDLSTWRKLYEMNVGTTLNASKAVIPHLIEQGGGAIVNIGANGAVKAGAGMGAYAASKSGVHRLTEALAEELKVVGVRVNAVLPSMIDTPTNRADMPDADFGKWVTPSDLAEVVLFLASDAGKAVTGALIPVMGGL